MVRALLLPDHYLVTVMLSGIKVRAHIGLHSGFGTVGVYSNRLVSLPRDLGSTLLPTLDRGLYSYFGLSSS